MTHADPYSVAYAFAVLRDLLVAAVVVTVVLFFVKGRG